VRKQKDKGRKRANHMYIVGSTAQLSGHVLHPIFLLLLLLLFYYYFYYFYYYYFIILLGEDSILCACVYMRVQLPPSGSDDRLVSPCICVARHSGI